MTICCIHLKDQEPFRVDIQGYFVTPSGALELRIGESQVLGSFGPNEWSYIHVPGVPGWPCELDEQDRTERANAVGQLANLIGERDVG